RIRKSRSIRHDAHPLVIPAKAHCCPGNFSSLNKGLLLTCVIFEGRMRDIWVDGAGQSRTIPDKSAKKLRQAQ
ncbi:MAG: hypothetical protein LBI31_02745, partial [Zoogloeaceae bacterium]|nr:hypothetical protein [Zoogloeaceae bacterium]